MLFEAIIASQTNTGEAVPSILGDILALALGHSKSVESRLKKCQEVNDAAQGLISVIKWERDKLHESVSSLKDRVEGFRVPESIV